MHTLETQPVPSSGGGPSDLPLASPGRGRSALERERANPLGSYLRARRERVTPEQVGLARHGVRRVPGLRREELALLAGISADYYLRLERGRDRNPSPQVLEALARALRLDQDHRAHLEALVAQSSRVGQTAPSAAAAPAGAIRLLDSLPHPAFIEDRYLDILAANPAATALDPRLAPGRNQLRDLLLDSAEQAMHPDPELAAACLIAGLRHTMGSDVADPAFARLTDELHRESAQFRRIWARHDVRSQRGATLRLNHPQRGLLRLSREQLGINGTAGLKLVVYYPEA